MKLTNYFIESGLSVAQFAQKLDVNRSLIYSYLKGEKTPGPATQKLIYKLTEGKVQPNDWVL